MTLSTELSTVDNGNAGANSHLPPALPNLFTRARDIVLAKRPKAQARGEGIRACREYRKLNLALIDEVILQELDRDIADALAEEPELA